MTRRAIDGFARKTSAFIVAVEKMTGHYLMRINDGRWSKEILYWWPISEKRKKGKPRRKWENEMRRMSGWSFFGR